MGSGLAVYEALDNGNDFVFKDINPAGARVGGRSREEHLGKSVLEVYPGVRELGLFDVLKRVWRTGEPETHPLSLYEDDSITLWVENFIFRLPTGEVVAVYEDLTEKKQAENALRESEERLRSIFDSIGAGVFAIDPEDLTITYINPSAARMIGLPKEEIIGRGCHNFICPVKECSCPVLDIGQVVDASPLELLAADGRRIPVMKTVSRTVLEGRDCLLESFIDLSELKETEKEKDLLESQLRQAQKMEAIGTLAGGIAHDFNNILSAIVGFTELVLEEQPEGAQISEDLKEVLKAGHRAKDLVKQILTFSRQTEKEARPVRITHIAKEAFKMLRSTLPSSIDVRLKMDDDLPTILADPTQIHQVFMNLCTNAAQAMEREGGVLEIKIDLLEVTPDMSATHGGVSPGRYLRLRISDTGEGMDDAVISRIFEPYFTTKQKGEGTGLGLAVVHGIVKRSGGDMTVKSEKGQGAEFTVYLPALDSEEEAVSESLITVPGGSERVLLVDDEPTIAVLGERMLSRLGYSVTTRMSPLEALELFRSDPARFDILVTDMTMPHMTGDELAKSILEIRPDIPVILCTGYSKKISREKAQKKGIHALVMKPLTQTELAKTVREVLDSQ
jgi:PAS domain S-box-containing protein